MKAQRKVLFEELLQTLAPHLADVLKQDQKPDKVLPKTIQQLTEQLLRAREKYQKQAKQNHLATPQATQQLLSNTITTALDTELAGSEHTGKKARHVIVASAEHLATKLTKLQNKRAKQESDPTLLPEADSLATQAPNKRPAASTRRPSRRTPPSSAASE